MKLTLRIGSAIIALLMMLAAFTACGKDETPQHTDNTEQTTVSEETTTVDETTTTAPTTATTTAPTTATTTVPTTIEPDVESSIIGHFATEQETVPTDKLIQVNDSEYNVTVVLEAIGTVTRVDLYPLTFSADGPDMYTAGEAIKIADSLTNGQKLYLSLDFPGDFSAWGLSYIDNTNERRAYTMYMSGEDGSLRMVDGIA